MSEMVRKQIYISRRQQTLLKRLSKQRGISEAEIVRQAIDREAANASAQMPVSNEDSWQQAVNFMRALRDRADQFTEPYHWNREELYAERLSRFNQKPAGSSTAENSQ
jgi:hypothetical protein